MPGLAAVGVEQVQLAGLHMQLHRRAGRGFKAGRHPGNHFGLAHAHGGQRLGAQRLQQQQVTRRWLGASGNAPTSRIGALPPWLPPSGVRLSSHSAAGISARIATKANTGPMKSVPLMVGVRSG